jgi:hypothetical protein
LLPALLPMLLVLEGANPVTTSISITFLEYRIPGRFWCVRGAFYFLISSTSNSIPITLVPLFVLNIDEPKLAGVYLRWWALAFTILCIAAVLSRLAVGLLYFLGEIIISRSDRIFYYINDLEWPFALLGWGVGMLITLNVWLKDLEPNVFKAFHIIFIMTIVRFGHRRLHSFSECQRLTF